MYKPVLSKSSFVRGLQCEKSLFLHLKKPFLKDPLSEKKKAIFNRGHRIGELAWKLFPNGKNAHKSGVSNWVAETRRLIEAGEKIIYEAAFLSSGSMCAVDILVKEEESWHAYEVKSSLKLSKVYFKDAAFQNFVIQQAGCLLSGFSLVYVNKDYEYDGNKIDASSFFLVRNVFEEVNAEKDKIAANIEKFNSVLAQSNIPQIDTGSHCFSPYTCDFFGHCWQGKIQEGSVFDLGSLSLRNRLKLLNEEKSLIRDLDENQFSEAVKIQILSEKSGRPTVDKPRLKNWIEKIRFPISFTDFEMIMPPVPLFKGTHPYEHIPVYFSLHRLEEPEDRFLHHDFFSEPGDDNRKQFLENFLELTQKSGTILAFNAPMETRILHHLSVLFPEFRKDINSRISLFMDLAEPFRKAWYYHPAMRGGLSLKDISGALFEGASFSELEIKEGVSAMIAYESLLENSDMFERLEIEKRIREYGALDTRVMIDIYKKLKEESI